MIFENGIDVEIFMIRFIDRYCGKYAYIRDDENTVTRINA